MTRPDPHEAFLAESGGALRLSPPLSHPFGAEPVPVSGKAGIANADEPFVGMEFVHRKWLGEDYRPLRCRVTRIAKGRLYWRSDDDGGPMHFPVEDFDKFGERVS